MKVVLHAGLHKSGTTSVQFAWREAFKAPVTGGVWYPKPPRGRLPGHHTLFFPLMRAFVDSEPADLAWARQIYSPEKTELSELLQKAERHGVETILFSTEELDRIQAADRDRLQQVLTGCDVTVLVTATRPVHRFASGWQTMVRHGYDLYPADLPHPVLDYTTTLPGRFREMVENFTPWPVIVRLVRTSPNEETLAENLAVAVGLRWPADFSQPRARNVSFGIETEILRRINAAGLSLGSTRGQGENLIRYFMGSEAEHPGKVAYADRPGLAERYAFPAQLLRAIDLEKAFLSGLPRTEGTPVRLLDPHGQLKEWGDLTPASWYAEISRREAVLPELDARPVRDPREELFRERQTRHGIEVRADRQAGQLEQLRAKLAQAQRQLDAERRAFTTSTSWRVTAPLRAVTFWRRHT